jgi:multiple sugar transport system permease protein
MRSGRHVPYLLIAPSLIFLTVLFLVPLGQTIALAFQADGGWSTANFSRMANDLNFSDAAANTFKIVVIVVPLQLCLALGMAMMLRHVQRGRRD